MVDRLPPLTALRAFDAAARHLSFAKAAEELNVTPAALSFQIKSLETHLGAPVFHRLNRAVALTQAGQSLAPGAADGFATLRAAWGAAQRAIDNTTLTVTAGPAFTSKWLAPRLFAFAQAHPEIELRFSATLKVLDFDRDDVDVAVRFGLSQDRPDLFSHCIYDEWMTPMMHPDLATKFTTPEDLLTAPLLHQDDISFLNPPSDWPAWFRAAGLTSPVGGARFSHADHALDAAVNGGGVVLGRITLAEKDLSAGRLVAPFDLALTTEAHFRFVCPRGNEARPQVRAFLDWVLDQTKLFEPYRKGRVFVAAADVAP